jgi:hypothetical protein
VTRSFDGHADDTVADLDIQATLAIANAVLAGADATADALATLNAHLEHLVEAVYDVAEAIRQSKLELTEERDINVLHDVNVVGRPRP